MTLRLEYLIGGDRVLMESGVVMMRCHGRGVVGSSDVIVGDEVIFRWGMGSSFDRDGSFSIRVGYG